MQVSMMMGNLKAWKGTLFIPLSDLGAPQNSLLEPCDSLGCGTSVA